MTDYSQSYLLEELRKTRLEAHGAAVIAAKFQGELSEAGERLDEMTGRMEAHAAELLAAQAKIGELQATIEKAREAYQKLKRPEATNPQL